MGKNVQTKCNKIQEVTLVKVESVMFVIDMFTNLSM